MNRASGASWSRRAVWAAALMLICVGSVSESAAQTVMSPTSLTYYAVQGATSPPNQTVTVSRTISNKVTLTTSDNASWLSVSPDKTSIETRTTLKVAVNTSGLLAGTYRATITTRVGTWPAATTPVTLIVSPATTSPPSTTSPSPSATSSATLLWNPVTGTTVSGYRIYVGEAPRQYSRTITVGNVTSSTVAGLTVGRMYYFAVTAFNGAGESAPSNEASKTIQ